MVPCQYEMIKLQYSNALQLEDLGANGGVSIPNVYHLMSFWFLKITSVTCLSKWKIFSYHCIVRAMIYDLNVW